MPTQKAHFYFWPASTVGQTITNSFLCSSADMTRFDYAVINKDLKNLSVTAIIIPVVP